MENNLKDIEVNEFLQFLKIACHVNDLIRESKETNLNFIDFDELASNKIVNELYGYKKCDNLENIDAPLAGMNTASEKSNTDSRRTRRKHPSSGSFKKKKSTTNFEENIQEVHPKLSKKLDCLINEGVLDSILPFICPPIPSKSQCEGIPKGTLKLKLPESISATALAAKSVLSTSAIVKDNKNLNETKRSVQPQASESNLSSLVSNELKPLVLKGHSTTRRVNISDEEKREDYDVVIHVCDEIKNTSRDFTCPQKLLVSKMGYFADVTAGQKLEDMDISVHCDIQIFEWLMKWIKKYPDQQDSMPQLDATNVVPILVSASFLQMEPLLLDCLSFCHARLTDVVRSSTNMSCLNDSIITRLAAMFTNLELEIIKDKRDRITPRLWTKLIQSLCEIEPQALRGHYFSLAGLFRCSKCGKYLTQTISTYIACLPSNIRLNRWGQLISQHTREISWNLSFYVASLFKDLQSWRKVYWKLWGHCHFLYCCTCETHFPVYQMSWCRFHPDAAQFLGPVCEGRMSGPTGRYPCCGQQAFRYETLPSSNGCKFREHSVLIENDRDRAILTLLQIAVEGGNLIEDPTSKMQDEIGKSSEQRWIGLCLMPNKCRQGLLPTLDSEDHRMRESRGLRPGTSNLTESGSETETSDTTEITKKFTYMQYSSSSDGCESENYSLNGIPLPRRRRIMELSGRYWSGELSARSNQDHQREYEEKVMKQVTSAIGKKNNSDVNSSHNTSTYSGTYSRLETEWKEQLKQRLSLKLKFK